MKKALAKIAAKFRGSEELADWLPWTHPLTSDVVATKVGGMLRVARVTLPDLETASLAALTAHHERLESATGTYGYGYSFWWDQWRKRMPGYPKGGAFNGVAAAQLVDASRERQFAGRNASVFVNTAFLAAHYVPTSRDAVLHYLLEEKAPNAEAALLTFIEETDSLFATLRQTLPAVDILGSEPGNGKPSPLASYLAASASYRMDQCLMPWAYLDYQLGGVEWETEPAPCIDGLHVRTVELHNFGPVDELALEELHQLPFECRWVTTMHTLDSDDQRKNIERVRRDLSMKIKGPAARVEEMVTRNPHAGKERPGIRRELDELDEIERVLGFRSIAHVHTNIHVFDEDSSAALGRAEHVASRLKAKGLKARVATLNAFFAPMGDVPGNVNKDLVNPRRPLVPIPAITRVSPVTGVSTGSVEDRRLGGPALLVAETRRKVPFYFAIHQPGLNVGHMAIIGQTGGGKSTLASWMAYQFLKYEDATVTVLDRLGSFMVPCLCAGGDWIELGGDGVGVQPLRHVDDEGERTWAHGWVMEAFALLNVEYTVHRSRAVDRALQHVAKLDPDERTLSALHSYMAPDAEGRAALEHFLAGGSYGDLFDGVVPSYGSARVLGIETATLANLRKMAPLAISACFQRLHRDRLRQGSHPKWFFVDEAKTIVRHPLIREEIESGSREFRKLNATLALATQSLHDLEDEQTRVIMGQMITQIFTPDLKAREPNFRKLFAGVGLTEEHIDEIAMAQPEGEYLFKMPGLTRLLTIRLEDEAKRICGASGAADRARARAMLAAGIKPGPEFLEAWLGEDKGGWVAGRDAA